jgi:outer membrane protein assembly factor BamE (lipoprotein component of BamABCDE complex)
MKERTYSILIALLLIGCSAGTNFKWSDVNRLKTGMTRSEVQAIMGEPYMRSASPNGEQWIWSHAQAFGNVKTVSIIFQNDSLTQAPSTLNLQD